MKKEDIVKLTEKLNKLNNENNKYKTFDSLYKDAIRFGAIVPTGDEHENELQKLKHEAMFKIFLTVKFGDQSIEFFNDLLSKDLFLQYLSYDKKRIDEIKTTWEIQTTEPDKGTTIEPPAGITLHTDLEPTRLDVLYSYLTDEKLIKTTPEMWRYWFTKPSLQAGKQPKKIQWLGAGSVLSNVTMLVCGNFTNHTEAAMKAAFKLQSGTNYQQPTPDRNKRGKYPYKRIYEIKEHAETKLQS